LQDLGMRVPGDVSVVGFDGLPQLGVSLTTVRQDIPMIACTALGIVTSSVHIQQRREVVLGTTVVQGRTSAAISS